MNENILTGALAFMLASVALPLGFFLRKSIKEIIEYDKTYPKSELTGTSPKEILLAKKKEEPNYIVLGLAEPLVKKGGSKITEITTKNIVGGYLGSFISMGKRQEQKKGDSDEGYTLID